VKPVRKAPTPSTRIADRRDVVANGWAKARHLELNAQCDDAVVNDYDRPRRYVQPCLPGMERWRYR
jgi:hypothetical protein